MKYMTESVLNSDNIAFADYRHVSIRNANEAHGNINRHYSDVSLPYTG